MHIFIIFRVFVSGTLLLKTTIPQGQREVMPPLNRSEASFLLYIAALITLQCHFADSYIWKSLALLCLLARLGW